MKKYFVPSIIKAQSSYIEKNYEILKENYLRKGYDSKILFSVYCLQMFEKDYKNFENKKAEEGRTYESSF